MIRIEMLCALLVGVGMHPILEAQTIPSHGIAINEIMYAPSAGGPEWIELVNTSDIDCSLRDWSLSDASTESKHNLTVLPVLISPAGFVVLSKDTVALKRIYPRIPCPVLQVPGFPSLNNGGDAVVLFDQNGTTVDSVRYLPDWGGSGGNSLERRNPKGTSGVSSNWAQCLDPSGGTPGWRNSTRNLDRDVAMVNVKARFAADHLVVVGTVLNVGLTPIAEVRVSLIVFTKETTTTLAGMLQPGDSDVVQLECPALGTGIVEGLMVVDDSSDQQQANNSQAFRVVIPMNPGALILNEIMFHPFQNAPEYVELFNPGSDSVDIRGWMIHDGSSNGESNRRGVIPDRIHKVPSRGFLLITPDTGFCTWYQQRYASGCPDVILLPGAFVLNDDEDRVVVHDASGSIVDSLTYRSTWHNPALASTVGRSLERTNPGGPSSESRSWTTCTAREGGTPGRINSIYAPSASSQAGILCSPNPFSPDGDGVDDVMLVQYSIPLRVATISISIYDVQGRRIRRLADHDPGSVTGVVPWDGRRDDGVRAPVGMYIIMLQATQYDGGSIYEARCVAVLALPL